MKFFVDNGRNQEQDAEFVPGDSGGHRKGREVWCRDQEDQWCCREVWGAGIKTWYRKRVLKVKILLEGFFSILALKWKFTYCILQHFSTLVKRGSIKIFYAFWGFTEKSTFRIHAVQDQDKKLQYIHSLFPIGLFF